MKVSAVHQRRIKALMDSSLSEQQFIDQTLEKAIRQKELASSQSIEIFTDGGSRGNPGPSGGGYGIFKAGELVAEGSHFYGHKTNNQAEYLALRDALRRAYELYADQKIVCYMDSKLAVEQVNGRWKVKSENVKPLFEEVRRIADQFENFSIKHVRREQNKLADRLANEAMDRGC